MARFLYTLNKKFDFVLAAVEGGNLHNAIAREAYAVIGLKGEDREQVRVLLNRFQCGERTQTRRPECAHDHGDGRSPKDMYAERNGYAIDSFVAGLSARSDGDEPGYRRIGGNID